MNMYLQSLYSFLFPPPLGASAIKAKAVALHIRQASFTAEIQLTVISFQICSGGVA